MDIFYTSTNYFLETVLMPRSITELYEKVDLGDWDTIKTSLSSDLSMWLAHYASYVACVTFAVLYIILLPLVGLIVCCCRNKGRCGGFHDPIEDKHNTCQRRCFAVSLLLLCVIVLFTCVVSFAVSGLMYAETTETGATAVISKSLRETGQFVDEIVSLTQTLYVNVTEQHLPVIQNTLVNMPHNCQVTVTERTELLPLLTEMETYLSGLNCTVDYCEQVESGIGELMNNSVELEFAINDLNDNMTAELSLCSLTDPYCNLTLEIVQNLSVAPNYIDLPSLESVIHSLTNISSGTNSVFRALDTSWNHLFQVDDIVSATAGSTLNLSLHALGELQHHLLIFTNLTSSRLMKFNFSQATDVMSTEVSPAVEDVGLITLCTCIALLLVLFVIGMLGLVSLAFGSCGKRPLPGAGCCSKGKASQILLCTNYTLFLSVWLIMLAMTVLFIIGSVAHNDICRHLVEPTDYPESSDTLDEIFTVYLNISTSIKTTLYNCQENSAVYSALNIEDLGTEYNISWITDLNRLGYTEAMTHLGKLNYSVEELDIFSSDLEQNLLWLDLSLQSIDFVTYEYVLTTDITTVDLNFFKDILLDAAENSTMDRLSNLYLSYAEQVSLLQEMFIIPLNETSTQALNDLQQVHTFSQSLNISQYIDNLHLATDSLTNQLVQDTVDDIASDTYNSTVWLTSEIELYINEELGHCRSIYDFYSYITTSVCMDFLYPLNTLWFMAGACLLVILLWFPTSFTLVGLYNKTDEYAEPFPSFTRMSFHRNNCNRSQPRSRTNHGHDIQAEIAMQRLSDPKYRRSRAPISALTSTVRTNQFILGTQSVSSDERTLGQSETDLSKLSESSEESDLTDVSKPSEHDDGNTRPQEVRGQRSTVQYPMPLYPGYANPGEISLHMSPEPMHPYNRPPPRQILTDAEDSGLMHEIYF